MFLVGCRGVAQPANHSNKNKKTQRGSRTAAVSENSRAQQTASGDAQALVPYNPKPNTDNFRLPSFGDRVFNTIQSLNNDAFLVQTTSVVAESAFFTIGQFPSAASLLAVFDQYRILGVEVTLYPQLTMGINTATGASPSGMLYTVVDYDDANSLPNIGAALQYGNCITTGITVQQRRCFSPRVALGAYSGTFTSFANVSGIWLDAASPQVQYYGLKIIADPGVAGQFQTYNLSIRAHIQLRATR